MGLFAKAAEKSKSEKKDTKKKSTIWNVGNPESSPVAKSLNELTQLQADLKAVEGKMTIHKSVVKNAAEENFIADFAGLGVMPESPMKVVNSEGNTATYVVQDRSGQYEIKEPQVHALTQLLGQDAVEELMYEETTIAFDRTVMAIPGVAEVIEKALERAIRSLTASKDGKKPIINEETAERLLDVKTKVALKPGTIERAASIVGKNQAKLEQFLEAAGSSCVRYVKV